MARAATKVKATMPESTPEAAEAGEEQEAAPAQKAKAKPKAKTKPKAKAKAKPKAKPKAKVTPKTKATAQEDPAAATEAKPTAKAPAKAKTTTKAKTKAKPKKTAAKAKAKPKKSVDPTTLFADDGEEGAPTKKGRKGTALIVVESPAKAKTIKKYLGAGVTVQASVGHIKDLPKSKIGVDIENAFAPQYEIIRGKTKIISEMRKVARGVDVVYLAPDPDREGEAIAWHIAEEIRSANDNIKRVLFNEITKRGITEALQHPTDIDAQMFDAQQTRRILDRLVGYQISPLLWNKVRRGLSAGRVQSVAVRIVCEREVEIGAFTPEEYWTLDAMVEGNTPPPFAVRLHRVEGQRPNLNNGALAHTIAAELRQSQLVVSTIERKERKKNPAAPFTTSKLQQEAAHKLRFSAKRTMGVAQRLYEGVELGAEGAVGLITYMRTDSTRISNDAISEVRTFIEQRYGKDLLPDEPNVYRSKKGNIQDAHEAIRPTSMRYDPELVRKLLSEEAQRHPDRAADIADQIKLYQLIWNRFVACQMRPAIFDQTTVDIKAGKYDLRATGQVLKAPGFTLVYSETPDDDGKDGRQEDPSAEQEGTLPQLSEGQIVRLLNVDPAQHFTQPPPRFSEASLVKELEEKGIGRPSTYATILSTIQDRGYVEKKEGRFHPTQLGKQVNGLLVGSFPDILNVDFTAQMEEDLDKIEEGTVQMNALLARFYGPFKADLEKAATEMKDLKREETPTDIACEKCGKGMVIKWGRNGEFLACSGYPECKSTREFIRTEEGKIEPKPEQTTDEICEVCNSPMVVKRGRFGSFLACSKYPECKTTKPISLGITCPRPDCGGFLTEKRSKRGSPFYGCSNYSKKSCDFVAWDRPIKEQCPDCGAAFLLRKETRRGPKLRCVTEGCGFTQGGNEDMPEDGTGEEAGA